MENANNMSNTETVADSQYVEDIGVLLAAI